MIVNKVATNELELPAFNAMIDQSHDCMFCVE